MTDGRRHGEWARSAARRQDILTAARQSFLQRGVEGASLRDIATRAGMTHAGVLHHFANKDELLIAVLEQQDQEETRRYEAAAPEAWDVSSVVSSLSDLMLEHQKDPEWMRLWAELTAAAARPEHTAHRYFVQRYADVHQLMTAALEQLAAQGVLREDVAPEVAASLLAAVLDGLQTQWLLDRESGVVEVLTEFLRLLMRPGAISAVHEMPVQARR